MEKPWLKYYDPSVPFAIAYPSIPVTEFLDRAAKNFPNRSCTIFQENCLTYAQVNALSSHLAGVLRLLGLEKGQRVGLLLPNCPQFVVAFYAVLKAGGVVVAMNPSCKERELAYQITDAGVELVISLRSMAPILSLLAEYTPLWSWILTDFDDLSFLATWMASPEGKMIDWGQQMDLVSLLQVGSKDLPPLPPVSSEDTAIFQYSGGTTGIPKAAIGLHRNLVANTLQFRHWLVGLKDGEEVVLAAIPLFHVYGMVIAMSVGVALGASLVLVDNPRDTDNLVAHIQKYHVTLFPGVPALYQAINRHPGVLRGEVNLSSVKACISGSAPLLRETKLEFERLTGGRLMEGYGLSEAPTATHCNPMFGENRIGSIGLPLPDVDCRIVDVDDGSTLKTVGEVGELILRGPQVMAGYHQRPEETAQTLRSGWLYTGDIAYMDANGFFYLVDRKKDLIKVGGFQVWPREIEEIIATYPGVKEVAVAGVPDPTRGEYVKAWVVVDPNVILDPEEIRRWCQGFLVRYKVPEEIEFVEALPRSTVGKILRRELVRREMERWQK